MKIARILRKLLKYSMLLISLGSALLLLLGRMVPSVNPYEQPGAGMLAYLVPVMVLVNTGFIVFWLITRKWWFTLIPLVALVFSRRVWMTYFALHFGQQQDWQQPAPGSFTVMSYNVRLLDLYNWSGRKETRAEMIRFFGERPADILCLQEFYTGNDSVGFDNISAIKYAGGYTDVAMCDVNVNRRGRWGSVIFSKFPIVGNANHDMDVQGSNLLQEVRVKIGNDTVCIFNIHLKSNRFTSRETGFVGQKALPEWNPDNVSLSRRIYQKVLRNTMLRGLEAKLAGEIADAAPYPSILCGDLNDIPSSYVYFRLRGKRKDVFLERGKGLGATYAGTLPVLRIDYLFYDQRLKALAYESERLAYSDHYPLRARFQRD